MSNFQHAGHTITLAPNGQFSAKIGATWVKKPSLIAMKKAIDAALAVEFKPFSALTETGYNEKATKGLPKGVELLRVEVVGIQKSTDRWLRGRMEFVVKKPGKEGVEALGRRALHPDTPDFITAYLAARAYESETSKIKEQRKREQDKLDAFVICIDPNEYFRAKA